jgi:hypothetical protein
VDRAETAGEELATYVRPLGLHVREEPPAANARRLARIADEHDPPVEHGPLDASPCLVSEALSRCGRRNSHETYPNPRALVDLDHKRVAVDDLADHAAIDEFRRAGCRDGNRGDERECQGETSKPKLDRPEGLTPRRVRLRGAGFKGAVTAPGS